MNRLGVALLIIPPFFLALILAIGPLAAAAAPAAQATAAAHRMLPGETLYAIALEYQVGLDDLMAANHLASPSQARAGMTLTIPSVTRRPQATTSPTRTKTAAPVALANADVATKPLVQQAPARDLLPNTSAPLPAARSGPCGSSYTVRVGDTIAQIAHICGVSAWDLAAINGIDLEHGLIYVDQTLQLSGLPSSGAQLAAVRAPSEPVRDCSEPFLVQVGDTLSTIGLLCGVSASNLMAWNGLADDDIWSGQRLHTRDAGVPPAVPTRVYVAVQAPVQPAAEKSPTPVPMTQPTSLATQTDAPIASTVTPSPPVITRPEPTAPPVPPARTATPAPTVRALPTYALNPTIAP